VDGDRVTLAPDRLRAGAWTLLGLVATGLAAWAFSAASWSLFYGGLVTACAVPTAVFALQTLAPETWTLEVDHAGVQGHVAAFPVAEPFATLRAVELRRVVGEPVLVLLGHTGRRGLLLPVGCDVQGLRRVLDAIELDKARGR
jgi:hypothetical protein